MDEERIKECLEVESGCRNLNITNECPFDFTCLHDGPAGIVTICPEIDDVCFDKGLQEMCIAMESNCRKFEITDGCPIEFSCLDAENGGPREPAPASRTLNQLFVLNIKSANSTRLEIVGNVTLGERNEGTLQKFVMFCAHLDPKPKLTRTCRHFQFSHPLGCLITSRIL
jgi:hypothetical protein